VENWPVKQKCSSLSNEQCQSLRQGGHRSGENKFKDFSRNFEHPRDIFPNLFHNGIILEFKRFQEPLTGMQNSKPFKHLNRFQGLSSNSKNEKDFQELSTK